MRPSHNQVGAPCDLIKGSWKDCDGRHDGFTAMDLCKVHPPPAAAMSGADIHLTCSNDVNMAEKEYGWHEDRLRELDS